MNLTGFGWEQNGRRYEVTDESYSKPFSNECIYTVSATKIENGEITEYFLSDDYLVTRVQREILNKVDELNYFYVHQDQERLIETVQELYALRGYLVDEN